MRYALNLADDGRVLSATFARFASGNMALVEEIPEDNIQDYIYMEGKYIYDPIIKEEVEETPSRMDVLEAQVTYTAMMTDTLLEV